MREMTMRWLPKAMLLMFSVLAIGCAREPDEAALRRALAEMETAVESAKPGDFLDHIAGDFAGQEGSVDAQQLRGTLAGLMLRHEKLGVTLGSPAIKLFGDRASIEVEALATGGSWMPETGQVLQIQSDWKRVDGEWKCFAATWTGRW